VAAEFESLEANLRQSFRVLATGRPRARIAELDGVSIASVGAAFQMFNAAFLNSPVATSINLVNRLDCAQAFFAACRLPWSFWICEDWLERSMRRVLVRTCEDFGLFTAAEMPGMAADSLREPGRFVSMRRSPPPLEIRRARTSDTMRDFRAIGSVCFHVPAPWFHEIFDDETPSREFACWVAYRGAEPVATAATVASDGAIGLYNVATMPEERGKGYAEAITRHAVAAASGDTGLKRVILQSTALGERLYRRLGFREVSRVVVFNSGGPHRGGLT